MQIMVNRAILCSLIFYSLVMITCVIALILYQPTTRQKPQVSHKQKNRQTIMTSTINSLNAWSHALQADCRIDYMSYRHDFLVSRIHCNNRPQLRESAALFLQHCPKHHIQHISVDNKNHSMTIRQKIESGICYQSRKKSDYQ